MDKINNSDGMNAQDYSKFLVFLVFLGVVIGAFYQIMFI
jgi:hypothetical protein